MIDLKNSAQQIINIVNSSSENAEELVCKILEKDYDSIKRSFIEDLKKLQYECPNTKYKQAFNDAIEYYSFLFSEKEAAISQTLFSSQDIIWLISEVKRLNNRVIYAEQFIVNLLYFKNRFFLRRKIKRYLKGLEEII